MQAKSLFSLLLAGGLLVAAQGVQADGLRQIDTNAVLGGAIGGGAGAAVGSAVGGRNGAIVGSAVGAAAGVVIATPDKSHADRRHDHHDHGHHYGHRKHHHKHHDHHD